MTKSCAHPLAKGIAWGIALSAPIWALGACAVLSAPALPGRAYSSAECAALIRAGDTHAKAVVPIWGAENGEDAIDTLLAADADGDPEARAALLIWARADAGGCWDEP